MSVLVILSLHKDYHGYERTNKENTTTKLSNKKFKKFIALLHSYIKAFIQWEFIQFINIMQLQGKYQTPYFSCKPATRDKILTNSKYVISPESNRYTGCNRAGGEAESESGVPTDQGGPYWQVGVTYV